MAEDDTQPGLTAEMLAEAVGDRVSVGDAYRITTVVPYTEQPPETNEYIMPPQDMDEFSNCIIKPARSSSTCGQSKPRRGWAVSSTHDRPERARRPTPGTPTQTGRVTHTGGSSNTP
jgi:hypothetical protein